MTKSDGIFFEKEHALLTLIAGADKNELPCIASTPAVVPTLRDIAQAIL